MASGFKGVTGSLGIGGMAGTVVASSVMTGGGVRSSGSGGATGCRRDVTITSSVASRLAVGERTRSQPHVSDSTMRAPTWIATDEMNAGPSDQRITVEPSDQAVAHQVEISRAQPLRVGLEALDLGMICGGHGV